MAALFLASKINENALKLREVINTYSVYDGKESLVLNEKVNITLSFAKLNISYHVCSII